MTLFRTLFRYSNIDGSPGFTKQSLTAISVKSEENPVFVNLVFDEMSVKKNVELVGKNYIGYVDKGLDESEDDRAMAVEALVVMAVAVNGSWKIPIAYFFINGITSDEKKNMVEQAISKLHDINVRVMNVTCDGLNSNQRMFSLLGADLSLPNPKPFFPHPCVPDWKVYITLDAVHMIKLVRNTLASEEFLVYDDGFNQDKISWNYIEKLHKLQQEENFKLGITDKFIYIFYCVLIHFQLLGNKLSKKHIEWEKNKMKVSLAVQVLSQSVADALDHCNKDLNLKEFKGSEGTANFCRVFDAALDILNSRSPFGKLQKAPLSLSNQTEWSEYIDKIHQYIVNLKTKDGILITKCRKKTGFVGFFVDLVSAKGLFQDLVVSNKMKYLLTYKFSQDHLELWFSAMRIRHGRNPNPTPKQFMYGYRKLIGYTDIKMFGGGNAVEKDNTTILDYSTAVEVVLDAPGFNKIN